MGNNPKAIQGRPSTAANDEGSARCNYFVSAELADKAGVGLGPKIVPHVDDEDDPVGCIMGVM